MIFKWWGHEYAGAPIPGGKKFKEGALVYYKVEIPLILRFKPEGRGKVLAWDEYMGMYLVGISRGVIQLHEDELTIKGRR